MEEENKKEVEEETTPEAQLQATEQVAKTSDSNPSSPISHSNIPLLLKIRQPSPDIAMATTESHDPITTLYTNTSDTEETTNMEVNVEDDEPPEDDVPHNTTQTRPSVINLGASLSSGSSLTTPTNHTFTPTLNSPTTHHHSNGERPERMREWLVRMINSGRFLGLEWIDEDNMVFRVPWVHAKKRDYNQERDAALFKEWAIHSGKYGDGSDVTTWKINFRCALNGLKDIIERKELEGPDCRVYQMLPSTTSGRRRKRRRPIIHYSEMMQLQTPPAEQPLPRSIRPKMELPLSFGHSITTPVDTPTTPMTLPTTPIQLVPIVTGAPSIPFPIPVATISASPSTHHHFPSSPTLLTKFRPLLPPIKPITYSNIIETHIDSETNHNSLPRQQALGSTSGGSDRSATPSSERTPEIMARSQFSPKSFVSSPIFSPKPSSQDKVVLPMYPPLRTGKVRWPPAQFADNHNALTIRIMYGSITVHMETIDCSKGCRIFYGPLHCRDILPPEEEERLFGPLEAHQISISPRHPSPLASEIFRTLKRGLIVDITNNDIYATALCRAVVYLGSSPMKNSKTLEKDERVKVFEYNTQFVPDLKQFTDSKCSNSPKPYVIFSFGQHWGSDRALSKNLITVVATHCKALNDLRVRNAPIYDELLYEPTEHQDIRIISPTRKDLDAEEFLNPSSSPSSTPH